MPTRIINLTDRYDGLVGRLIDSGLYKNASEVVRAGLRLLERQEREDEAKLQALRGDAEAGLDAYRRRDVTVLDDDAALDRFFDDMAGKRTPPDGRAMVMRKLSVTEPARSDLRDIRRYAIARYGRRAADAYGTLLKQALRDLRDDPLRPGSKPRPEIAETLRSCHAALSRERAEPRVRSPRHFILYFLSGDGDVVVSRILHDARDLARHVPDSHVEAARAAKGRGPG